MLSAVFLVAPLCVLLVGLVEYAVLVNAVVDALYTPESEIEYLGCEKVADELYCSLGIVAAY